MRTDTATRLVPAAPEAVYRAFVDATALMAWLPPAGMSGRALLFEPWEGGCHHHHQRRVLRFRSASAAMAFRCCADGTTCRLGQDLIQSA
jgi:uncharacterized protein YndB with AHSA1/START domain